MSLCVHTFDRLIHYTSIWPVGYYEQNKWNYCEESKQIQIDTNSNV